MPAPIGNYQGGYKMPAGMQGGEQQPPAPTVTEQLVQVITVLASIRADEVVRDPAVDEFLAMTIEGLTKIAEGESVANMLPQESTVPSGQSSGYQPVSSMVSGMYRKAGRVGG